MKIKKLKVKNYKSLVDIEIYDPNPFTVLIGANGVGKSSIFEALEFAKSNIISDRTERLSRIGLEELDKLYTIEAERELVTLIEKDFGGREEFLNFLLDEKKLAYSCIYEGGTSSTLDLDYDSNPVSFFANLPFNSETRDLSIYKQFYTNYTRLFIGRENLDRLPEFKSRYKNDRLQTSAGNLEKVLKRLLKDSKIRDEIVEYLQLLVPEFENVAIHSDNIGGTETLLVYEKNSSKPFGKNLISDGTYNILCLLTAIFQSDEPQFLCIEEPENGLTPYAIEVLVDLIRDKCKEKGHYIWLNTHSQTLVRKLKEEELILVSKVDGATQVRQLKSGEFFGLKADEAWLTNALGAGLPW